jgi:putrescine transport system permease protein
MLIHIHLGDHFNGGGSLSFTLSLDDLVLASFVSGPGSSTLPMVVFSSVRLGLSPEVNALATLMLGAIAVATTSAAIWVLYRQRRQPTA